jgi:hypothetical protein
MEIVASRWSRWKHFMFLLNPQQQNDKHVTGYFWKLPHRMLRD